MRRTTTKGCENVAALKNPRWEAFAQALAKGLSQRKAYREAYPKSVKWKDKTVDNKAYELTKNGEVMRRYEELKDKAADCAVLTRKEKRELLAQMARDEKLSPVERQRAIDIDNKMEDEYVTKIEGNLNVTKLEDLI